MSTSYSIRVKFSGDEATLKAAETACEEIRAAAFGAASGEAWPESMWMLEDSTLSEGEEWFLDEVFSCADRKGVEAWDVDAEVQGGLLSVAECVKSLVPELSMDGEMARESLTTGERDRCLVMGLSGSSELIVDEVL